MRFAPSFQGPSLAWQVVQLRALPRMPTAGGYANAGGDDRSQESAGERDAASNDGRQAVVQVLTCFLLPKGTLVTVSILAEDVAWCAR